jgi:DinB superfamily
MAIDWNRELFDQLDWHWRNHLRLRFDGLTDDEYFWEPVPGWSIRPREGQPGTQFGPGKYAIDYVFPEPVPPPVTTIAWRLGHIIRGVLAERTEHHFGGPPADFETFEYAGTAAEALTQLDDAYARWAEGVRGLGAEGLLRPCGPAEGPYAEFPLASLILHINRETIHHGAEIALLRDLYRAEKG